MRFMVNNHNKLEKIHNIVIKSEDTTTESDKFYVYFTFLPETGFSFFYNNVNLVNVFYDSCTF